MTKKKSDTKKSIKTNVKKKSPSTKELNENLKVEQDKYLRLFAEFENYKRRTAKERIELFKTAGKEILTSLVPVLEDFKRALSQENSDSDNDEGINLIFNKFNETLKSQGLTEVEVNIGDIFDPEIHEAISQIPATEDDQKGKIIDIIQGGYKLGDSIINFPKVVVAQ
ncbi:MAG: nucleotide exchange factor GrpE [Candidatus Marisimplicoccus sp.]|tara:strand:+ start:1394 stop:1897 length:504 start_codon:yes stop_codon:yes gene_type:complete